MVFASRLVAYSAVLFAVSAAATAQSLVISEFMARNSSVLRDPAGQRLHDWIEIHNPTAASVNAAGWYLTDRSEDLTKWRLPSRTIAPFGHEIVYASGAGWTIAGQPLHTSFELDGDGEYLALVAPDGVTIATEYAPAKQYPDVSYGLIDAAGTHGYMDEPTPGAPNSTISAGVEVAKKVKASVVRGRYSAPFDLTLTTASSGATIRYTTDGSKPTRSHGHTYVGPIRIDGTTVVRAVAFGAGLAASKAATFSYLFFDDVLTQSAVQTGYPTDWGTHSSPSGPYTHQADYEVDPAIAASPTYGPMMITALESLPILALTMDVGDLFGARTGIYANSMRHGEEWERPASIEFLYPRMERQQQVDVGVRISGSGTRRPWSNSKYSLRLLFKGKHGASDLDADLFGLAGADEHNTLILRSVYGDGFTTGEWQTYLRDVFFRETELEMGRTSSRGTFCHLFINGLYWGLYNPSERPDAAFQSQYFGGSRGDYDVIKHGPHLVDGDWTAYRAAKTIANAGLASAPAYAAIQEYVDVVDLADYMLLNMFGDSTDWPWNNYYMARRREPGERFRFYSWDTEASLARYQRNLVGTRATEGPALFYDRLRDNEEFRLLVADRAHALLFHDGPLTTTRCVARFERLMRWIRPAIVAESARWGDHRTAVPTPTRTLADWDTATNAILQRFFPRRPGVFVAQLRQAGLYPTLDAPVLSRHGGVIQPGQGLSITAPTATSRVYYTTDGTDPRLAGGAVSARARQYVGPLALTGSIEIRARALEAGTWSALTRARFQLPSLVVNEVLASNHNGITDEKGEADDWIELVNVTTGPVDATGMFLSDDLRKPTKWKIEAGVVPPGGTLLVWADEDGSQGDLHANFKLDAGGEEVWLFDADGSLVSGFRFGPQETDVSTGWFRDGGGSGMLVTFAEPTPGATNEITSGRRIYSGRALDLHPMQLDAIGAGQIGAPITLALDEARPNESVVLLIARGAGYTEILGASSEVAFLVDPSAFGMGWLPADGSGRLRVPLPLPNDPSAAGIRIYLQTFALDTAGIRGSNGIELVLGR